MGGDRAKHCTTHLVPDDSLLDRCEVLERAEQEVAIRGSAEVGDKGPAELLGEREQDLVLVVEAVLQEGDELVARALRAQGQGDGGEAVDGVEAKVHIVRLELVDQDGDRVQLLVGIHLGQMREKRMRLRSCERVVGVSSRLERAEAPGWDLDAGWSLL